MPDPPRCGCHDEPMYWHKLKWKQAGGLWRCRIRKREVQNAARPERYAALTGLERGAETLRLRRVKGLQRMAARHARRQQEA